jgi:UDP-GlcNAc:undecaprenyl-phosphate GlcNAc-1-phosphate transferase
LPALIPAIWFWLPVLDCVRLMLSRALDRRSPFAADRNHFHHILIDRFGRRTALAVYLLLLGIPALAGEFSLAAGLSVLAICALLYLILVVQRQLLLGSTSPKPIT